MSDATAETDKPRRFGKGYVPDPHDRSEDQTVRHVLGAPVTVPAEFTLAPYVTEEVKNQGETSACVGFASARAVHVRCAFVGTPIPWPSPACAYTVARAMARRDAKTPLVDAGSSPTLAAEGMGEWGIASNEAWPFDPKTINDEPDLPELEDASLFENVQTFRIDSELAQRVADVKHSISSGYPVMVGTEVDRDFEDYMGGEHEDGDDSPIAVTAPVGELLGGHMLCLIGYFVFRGITYFLGINSWGTGWGNKGYFVADVAWLTNPNVMDVIAVTGNATAHGVEMGARL